MRFFDYVPQPVWMTASNECAIGSGTTDVPPAACGGSLRNSFGQMKGDA